MLEWIIVWGLVGKVLLSWWKCNYIVLEIDEEEAIESQKPPYSPGCLPPCAISHLEPCLFSCLYDRISNLLISYAVENYFLQQVIELLFGMKITDVFKTMYLAQKKHESQIPFSSRPCPKACQLKSKKDNRKFE